jgi:hypothetical protein
MCCRVTITALLLASLLAPAVSGVGEPFMEIEGILVVDSGGSGEALVRIEQVYRYGAGAAEAGALEVTCPAADLGATAVISPGQNLMLDWEVVRPPKRRAFRRARGGRVRLSVPAEGWAVVCGDGAPARLYGQLVTEAGSAPELMLEGDRGGVLSLVGLGRGEMPSAPERVRIRLAWSPNDFGPALTRDVAVVAERPGGQRR